MPADHPILVPDLGESPGGIRFVLWLVPLRARVIAGERIAELLIEGISFHLEADREGTVTARRAQPGAVVRPGDVLGTIRGDGV